LSTGVLKMVRICVDKALAEADDEPQTRGADTQSGFTSQLNAANMVRGHGYS